MTRPDNEIRFVARDGTTHTVIVPATLMPVTLVEKNVSFHEDGTVKALQSQFVAARAHGLEYREWGQGPDVLVVGAELFSQSAADYFRGGLQLSAIPGLAFPDETTVPCRRTSSRAFG